jgi:uncharacterized membrane protein
MDRIVNGVVGWTHLMVSVVALVTGLLVLLMKKGTVTHKRVGYVYAMAMLLVNGTAFFLYRLFGGFGLFHWMAIVSLLTLAAGLYPVWTRKGKDYLITHFNFMYWSVVGLYCALMAEIFSRLPKIVLTPDGKPVTAFYSGVGIGIAVVMTLAVVCYLKFQPRWKKQFGEATPE